jgi:hypothetical protein
MRGLHLLGDRNLSWSQSTYWTLPPTALAWAKAGTATANISARITATNFVISHLAFFRLRSLPLR